MTKASVVIPTYDRADVITRAVDSALAQTLSDVEVIVVDDASTDDTRYILESYEDRIEFYLHEENKGGSAARNTGIDAASGEYIAFLDSDDTWEPTKLEKQIDLLERRDDEWVAAYCDFRQTRSNSFVEFIDNIARRPTGIEGDTELIERIFLRKFAHGGASTLVVRREIVDSINGFDESFDRHQDLEFLIRVLQEGKIGYIDEVLVKKHDTGRPPLAVARQSMDEFSAKFEEILRERGLYGQVYSTQRFMIAKFYFGDGRFREGLESLRGATMPHYRDGLGLFVALLRGIRTRIAT